MTGSELRTASHIYDYRGYKLIPRPRDEGGHIIEVYHPTGALLYSESGRTWSPSDAVEVGKFRVSALEGPEDPAAFLKEIGKCLYGPRWEASLAAALGYSTRTMNRWSKGGGVHQSNQRNLWRELAGLLERRIGEATVLMEQATKRDQQINKSWPDVPQSAVIL
jgi:hypothetical protein